MIVYLTIACVLTLFNLVMFVFLGDEKRLSYYVIILSIIMSLSNFGYLEVALSKTLEGAMLANDITYLSGCFMPPIMFFLVCALCNISVKRWIRIALYLFSGAVYLMILTAEETGFYYTDYKLGNLWGATVLQVEKGFGYNFFYLILYGYIVLDLAMIIYAFRKKMMVSKFNLWLLTGIEVFTMFAFLVGRMINPDFEIIPAIYVVDGMIFRYLYRRVTKYNVEENVNVAMKKENTYGYIMFDDKRRYLGCNDIAAECIPALRHCKIDHKFTSYMQPMFIYEWLDDYEKDNSTVTRMTKDEIYYECHITKNMFHNRFIGYIIEMQDHSEKKKYLDLMANYNYELENKIGTQTRHIKDIQTKVIIGMASMVENRDNSTGGHIHRTSDVVRIFVDTIKQNHLMDLSETFCEDLIKAAPMHDLGKIGVADSILQKPGRLTDEEFEQMKTHAARSAEIVEKIMRGVEEEHFVNVSVNVAHYHHEKWNGMGYPKKLQGEQIPLEARIMAVADVYDALVSKRCYKEPMSFEDANNVMMESMGSHFDPGLEQMYMLSRKQLEKYYANLSI